MPDAKPVGDSKHGPQIAGILDGVQGQTKRSVHVFRSDRQTGLFENSQYVLGVFKQTDAVKGALIGFQYVTKDPGLIGLQPVCRSNQHAAG